MEIEEQWDWWMLSAPLEVAVMNRMGLKYPTFEEFKANGWVWMRPSPDMKIVGEEIDRLKKMEETTADGCTGRGVGGFGAGIEEG